MEFVTAKEIQKEMWRDFFNALIKEWKKINAFLSLDECCAVKEQITDSYVSVPRNIVNELEKAGWSVDAYHRVNADTGQEYTMVVLNVRGGKL